MDKPIFAAAFAVCLCFAPSANAGDAAVWELRQAGTGLRCAVTADFGQDGAPRFATFDPQCAEIVAGLTGGMAVVMSDDRIAFTRADGTVELEFSSGEGDVFESVDARALPILLSSAQ
ncbi:MAG: hypothetical protein IPL47_12305 [Phyllobacteriaceae bacterium]|nr:hypothetical protein [Phyllobacteriaceae bacterium]